MSEKIICFCIFAFAVATGTLGYNVGFVDGRSHGYKQCLIEQDGPRTARTFHKGADHAR